MGFYRQEYWSGLPCAPPVGLPDPGTEPTSLMSPALAGRLLTTGATWGTLAPPACMQWHPQRVFDSKLQDIFHQEF